MGETAEFVAQEYDISREDQDAFALESHRRAVAARDEGRFKDEIVPVEVPQRKGDPLVIDADEPPRPDTSLEKMAKLKPAFTEGGTVTAGNSSGINDGASSLLLASPQAVESNGWKPLARVVTSAVAGVEPRMMGVGPVHATRKALERAGLSIEDIDLVELNEAFAAQSLACIREARTRHGARERQRGSDRPRSSTGLLRSAHPHDAGSRDAATRVALRPRHHVHRRRPGHRHHRRASVSEVRGLSDLHRRWQGRDGRSRAARAFRGLVAAAA